VSLEVIMELRFTIQEAEEIIEKYVEDAGHRVVYFNLDENNEPYPGVKFCDNKYFKVFIGRKLDENTAWYER